MGGACQPVDGLWRRRDDLGAGLVVDLEVLHGRGWSREGAQRRQLDRERDVCVPLRGVVRLRRRDCRHIPKNKTKKETSQLAPGGLDAPIKRDALGEIRDNWLSRWAMGGRVVCGGAWCSATRRCGCAEQGGVGGRSGFGRH